MKNSYFIQFLLFVVLSILIFSCDNAKSEWDKVCKSNTIIAYQDFIKNHSSSDYVEKAKDAIDSIQFIGTLKTKNIDSLKQYIKTHSTSNYLEKAEMIIDSIEMFAVLKTHNADTIELFLKDHSASKFLKKSKTALDSIDWNIACYSKDTVKLRKYTNQYPKSQNNLKALDLIKEIKNPTIKISFANSISIGSNGNRKVYGALQFVIDDSSPLSKFAGGQGPNKVYVWRNFSNDELPFANKLNIKTGNAYLKISDNLFKFIRKIDMTKSDKEICLEFGITSNQSWGTSSLEW